MFRRKLEEWVDEDGFGPAIDPELDNVNAVNKNSRVVVLKHMFTLDALETQPTLLIELKEDVREECERCGEVTNVVLYDVSLIGLFSQPEVKLLRVQKEKDGIMTVKFREPLAAEKCVIVSRTLRTLPETDHLSEDEREILRWTQGRSLIIFWEAEIPAEWSRSRRGR